MYQPAFNVTDVTPFNLPDNTKAGNVGGLNEVARADHVHPIGTLLRFAQNAWDGGGWVNILPDTNTWVMSSGRAPDVSGGYAFEATFQMAWEGFSCFFDAEMLTAVQGKAVEFGVSSLAGASARLELVIDGSVANYILATATAASVQVNVPATAQTVTLRIIIFSSDDLHCSFSGVYMNDTGAEMVTSKDEAPLYLEVRKVKRENLPAKANPGAFYLTEDGGFYFGKDDGSFLPIGGSRSL